MKNNWKQLNRRSFIRKSAGAAAGVGSLATNEDAGAVLNEVNENSIPSDLQITDVETLLLEHEDYRRYIVKILTNQDIYGLADIEHEDSLDHLAVLADSIIGLNPCHVDMVFQEIKNLASGTVQGAAASAIEMACWDLAGKAWNIPVWQMLGGKFRDSARVYPEIALSTDGEEMGNTLRVLRLVDIVSFFNVDIGINLLKHIDGAIEIPSGVSLDDNPRWIIHVTDAGIKYLSEYMGAVRAELGWTYPIGTTSFSAFTFEDNVRIAQALDEYNLAWYADMAPADEPEKYWELRRSCTTPLLSSDDIYLKEGYEALIESKAVALCRPNISHVGGLIETKKIGDWAMENGIALVIDTNLGPVSTFAAAHVGLSTDSFQVQKCYDVREDWYDDMVEHNYTTIVQYGFVKITENPGFGIDITGFPASYDRQSAPKEYAVDINNYPNPFNAQTTIQYVLPMQGKTSLNIYSVNGQRIRELVSGFRDKGFHTAVWDGTDDRGSVVPSGMYITQIKIGAHSATGKITLLK